MTERNNLPHWNQENKLQFVTFRLADSLPQSTISQIRAKQKSFRETHPEPWDSETERQYNTIATTHEEKLLDNGYGECVFRNGDIRDILLQTILLDNHRLYELWSIVIMPNHIHMIIQPHDEQDLKAILYTIRRISSHKINKALHRKGELWDNNYFDRIIRDQTHLETCLAYIAHNPQHLPSSVFTLLTLKTHP